MKIIACLSVVLTFFVSVPAAAQFNGGMDWVVNRTRVPVIIQCPGCNDGESDNTSPPPQALPAASSLSYKPSVALRRQNLARFAAETRKQNPQSADQMDKLFGSVDFIGQIDNMMRPMGLRADNVADAYALWWVVAWHAANGRQGEPNRTTMAAVKQQAANALLATPQFAATNNAQKQEMAEALLVQTALIDASIDDAAGNSTKVSALARAVNQGAQHMGLDLTKMTLTQDGFVPRSGGRSDVSDAAGDDSQLAANDHGAQADGANMGDYALYAVAGTGLLAGAFALGKGFSKKG